MIAKDLQPLSVVEDSGFLDFCKTMDSKYKVPSRRHVRDVMLPQLFKEEQAKVQELMALAKFVSITTDMWTSTNNDAFLAVTAHYWHEASLSLMSSVLDCAQFEGKHTGVRIKDDLKRVMEAFHLVGKVLTIVTDNGANMVKACTEMLLRRLACYAHNLNLIAMDAIKGIEAVNKARSVASDIVTRTKKSNLAKEELFRCQKSLGIPTPKKLLQEVETRWNSTFLMMERMLELKEAVSLLLAHSSMKNISQLTSDTWESVQDAVEVLRPLYEATLELSGEKFATASKIIPLTKMLMSAYATMMRQSSPGTVKHDLAKAVLNGLNDRFAVVEDTRVLGLATLLDPRFKNRGFRSDEKKKKVLDHLQLELQESIQDTAAQKDKSEAEPTAKRAKGFQLWDKFDEEIERQSVSSSIVCTDTSQIDIRNYLSLPCQPRQKNPFEWWVEEGKKLFPSMYPIAMKYLSIPATSVPSERVFSVAGEIISKKRISIAPENAKMLIFLHGNV